MTRKRTPPFRQQMLSITFSIAAVALLATVSMDNLTTEAIILRRAARLHLSASSSSSSVSVSSVGSSSSTGPRLTPREAIRLRGLQQSSGRSSAPQQAGRTVSRRTILNTTSEAPVEDAMSRTQSVIYERSKCGDNLVIAPETCDDGNSLNSDGCSSSCVIEAGYQCTKSQPSYCWDECGDGRVSAREKCDDGNGEYNDGCSEDCRLEPGYTCTGSPSACTHS